MFKASLCTRNPDKCSLSSAPDALVKLPLGVLVVTAVAESAP